MAAKKGLGSSFGALRMPTEDKGCKGSLETRGNSHSSCKEPDLDGLHALT